MKMTVPSFIAILAVAAFLPHVSLVVVGLYGWYRIRRHYLSQAPSAGARRPERREGERFCPACDGLGITPRGAITACPACSGHGVLLPNAGR